MESSSFLVKAFMAKELITFTPDMDVNKAMFKLIENKISGAPVIDQNGKLVGILSEHNCMQVVVNSHYYNMPGGQVRDFMTKEVKTVSPEMDIIKLAELFMQTNYRRFPVVEGKNLVGQISRRDILKAVLALIENHQSPE